MTILQIFTVIRYKFYQRLQNLQKIGMISRKLIFIAGNIPGGVASVSITFHDNCDIEWTGRDDSFRTGQ